MFSSSVSLCKEILLQGHSIIKKNFFNSFNLFICRKFQKNHGNKFFFDFFVVSSPFNFA